MNEGGDRDLVSEAPTGALTRATLGLHRCQWYVDNGYGNIAQIANVCPQCSHRCAPKAAGRDRSLRRSQTLTPTSAPTGVDALVVVEVAFTPALPSDVGDTVALTYQAVLDDWFGSLPLSFDASGSNAASPYTLFASAPSVQLDQFMATSVIGIDITISEALNVA